MSSISHPASKGKLTTREQLQRFLEALIWSIPEGPKSGAFLEIAYRSRDAAEGGGLAARAFRAKNCREAAAFALARNDDNSDVWYGINPRDTTFETKLSHAKAEQIPLLAGFYVDDPEGQHEALEDLLPPPSFVVETSPGKIQAIWLLREPIPRGDPTWPRAVALQKELARALRADAAGTVERVLRCPFTRNLKYPETPTARIIGQWDCSPEHVFRYVLEEVERLVEPQTPGKGQPPKEKDRPASYKELPLGGKWCLRQAFKTGVSEGVRNNVASILASELRKLGKTWDDCETLLLNWNKRNDPPLSVGELRGVVKAAYERQELYDYGCGSYRQFVSCDEEQCSWLEKARHHAQEQRESGGTDLRRLVQEMRRRPSKEILAITNKMEISGLIRRGLGEAGSFLYDRREKRYYYFDDDGKRLWNLESDEFAQFLNEKCGLNAGDASYFQYVLEDLKTAAWKNPRVNVFKVCHFDDGSNRLYIYRNDGQVYRLDGTSVTLIDNGDDDVLFSENPRAERFSFLEGYRPDAGSLADEYLFSLPHVERKELDTKQQQMLFKIWFHSMFFDELLPTRPILALIGPKGSGKSLLLKAIGWTLLGPAFDVITPVEMGEDDFDSHVASHYYTALDNADGRIPWLNNKLAAMATGGVISKRKLYTTLDNVEIPINTFTAINSRDAYFRRDDVASRLLLLRTQALSRITPERDLKNRILSSRDEIMTEVMINLNRIIQVWKQQELEYPRSHRLGDWVKLATYIGHAFRVGREAIEQAVVGLTQAQQGFVLEDNPVMLAIGDWIAAQRKLEGGGDLGLPLSTKELYRQLCDVGGESFKRQVKSARSLGQRLGNELSDLTLYFDIERITDPHTISYKYIIRGEKAAVREDTTNELF